MIGIDQVVGGAQQAVGAGALKYIIAREAALPAPLLAMASLKLIASVVVAAPKGTSRPLSEGVVPTTTGRLLVLLMEIVWLGVLTAGSTSCLSVTYSV